MQEEIGFIKDKSYVSGESWFYIILLTLSLF